MFNKNDIAYFISIKPRIVMTVREYCNKINILGVEENIFQLSEDIDLENSVLKILHDSVETYLTPEILFNKSTPDSVILNHEIIELFSDHYGLLFLNEKEIGNVCFANSSELRPEFRQSFTAIDILDYIHAFVHSSFYKEFQKIAITSDVNIFWKLVKIGASLRKGNK